MPGLYSDPYGYTFNTESYDEMEHPQDHTRLKTAWDEMLNFLSPNILSVIPFYLTSTYVLR